MKILIFPLYLINQNWKDFSIAYWIFTHRYILHKGDCQLSTGMLSESLGCQCSRGSAPPSPHLTFSEETKPQRITIITCLMGHLMSHSGTTGHTSTLPTTGTILLSSLGNRTHFYKPVAYSTQLDRQAAQHNWLSSGTSIRSRGTNLRKSPSHRNYQWSFKVYRLT